MELRYHAIVLKKREVGETDRLYVLYTAEQGKVRLIAKGIRRPEAKLAGQLETLMRVQVTAVKGRGIGKIAGALAEEARASLRTDYEAFQRTMEAVGIFEQMVDLDEADPELFTLLSSFLSLVDECVRSGQPRKAPLLTEGFLFQLFDHLGYRIETGTCAVSGKRLQPGERHFFSPSAGGILSGEHGHESGATLPISENAIKLIRLFLGNKLEHLSRIRADETGLREVRQVATRFFRWIAR